MGTQRVVISGTKSTWRPVTSGVGKGLMPGIILIDTFIHDVDDGWGRVDPLQVGR